MAVHCGKCGAELMGAVNRCWKCGQQVVSRSDGSALPPVRRPPVDGPLEVPPWESLPAVIVDDQPANGAPLEGTNESNVGGEPAGAITLAAKRRQGSPFVQGAKLRKISAWYQSRKTASAANQRRSVGATPEETYRPISPVQTVIAILAISLGAGSFALGDYPEVALAFATVGLGFGITAVISRTRLTSVAGFVICFLAFLWAGYSTAVTIYERSFGVSPWADKDEFELEPMDDTLQP